MLREEEVCDYLVFCIQGASTHRSCRLMLYSDHADVLRTVSLSTRYRTGQYAPRYVPNICDTDESYSACLYQLFDSTYLSMSAPMSAPMNFMGKICSQDCIDVRKVVLACTVQMVVLKFNYRKPGNIFAFLVILQDVVNILDFVDRQYSSGKNDRKILPIIIVSD